jgi:hypothetical protein
VRVPASYSRKRHAYIGRHPTGDFVVFTLLQRCLCGILCARMPGRGKSETSQTVADAPAPLDREPSQQAGQERPANPAGNGGGKAG